MLCILYNHRHSIYNNLSPLDSPTSYWSSVFSGLNYDTEDDYRLRAFKRLEAINPWVIIQLNYYNEVCY